MDKSIAIVMYYSSPDARGLFLFHGMKIVDSKRMGKKIKNEKNWENDKIKILSQINQ